MLLQPLYWLPKSLEGQNVILVLTTSSSDKRNIDALEEYRGVKKLDIQPLTVQERKDLCLVSTSFKLVDCFERTYG